MYTTSMRLATFCVCMWYLFIIEPSSDTAHMFHYRHHHADSISIGYSVRNKEKSDQPTQLFAILDRKSISYCTIYCVSKH